MLITCEEIVSTEQITCAPAGMFVVVLTNNKAGEASGTLDEVLARLTKHYEQVGEVRRWLGNYHRLREALEAICELNHALLRPDGAAPRRGRSKGD